MSIFYRIRVALQVRRHQAREAAIERAWQRERHPHATQHAYTAWRRSRGFGA